MEPADQLTNRSSSDTLSEQKDGGACLLPSECLPTAPLKMLVRIAKQGHLADAEGCAAILTMLSASRMIRMRTQRMLAQLSLTELKLHTLIHLYALDPDPSTPAELADANHVSRAAMTEVVEAMVNRAWIHRDRANDDRRRFLITLTDEGRNLVERAVSPFLFSIDRCAQGLTIDERNALARACHQLSRQFEVV